MGMSKLLSRKLRVVKCGFGMIREREFTDVRPILVHRCEDQFNQRLEAHVQEVQQINGKILPLFDDSQQQILGPDAVVVHPFGGSPCELHRSLRCGAEALELRHPGTSGVYRADAGAPRNVRRGRNLGTWIVFRDECCRDFNYAGASCQRPARPS